jgi:putative Ca2+/H+ antiporter (TMEM165/GDT1 family)
MIDFQKLKREWKTFVLAVVTAVAGAWQFAVANGASLPNLFSWVPQQYQSATLFLVGFAFLALRKYADPDTPIV